MRSRRFSSLRACSSTSGGMPALVIASASSAISSAPWPSSPSSLRIWRICSRSRNLALAVVERFLGLLLDLPRELEHLDAAREQGRDALEPVRELGRLQDAPASRSALTSRKLAIMSASIDGDSIAWIAVRELGRRLRQQRDRLDGLLLQVQRARLDIGVGERRCRSGTRRARRGTESRPPGRARGSGARPGTRGDACRPARSGNARWRRPCRRDAGRRSAGPRCLASFCSRKPTLASVRTASCAPATVFSRLIATGSDHAREQHHVAHRQDDQHVRRQVGRRVSCPRRPLRRLQCLLRVVRGRHVHLILCRSFSAGSAAAGGSRSRIPGRPAPRYRAAAPAGARRVRRESRAVGSSAVRAPGQRAFTADHDFAGSDDQSRRSGGTPGNAISISTGLARVDVDGRLPLGLPARARRGETKKLPLQAFRLFEQVAPSRPTSRGRMSRPLMARTAWEISGPAASSWGQHGRSANASIEPAPGVS